MNFVKLSMNYDPPNQNICKIELYNILIRMMIKVMDTRIMLFIVVVSTLLIIIHNTIIDIIPPKPIPNAKQSASCDGDEYNEPFSPELNYIRKSFCKFNYFRYSDKTLIDKTIVDIIQPKTIQKVNTQLYNIDKLCIGLLLVCVLLLVVNNNRVINNHLYFNKKTEERLNKLEKENIEFRKIMDELRTPKSSYM